MAKPPLVTVVLPVYKRADFLRLVIEGLARQDDQGFEVVVAEDDRCPAVAEVVAQHRRSLGERLQHVSQEDRGFRKTRILNAALGRSRNPFIVFLDGDCIPHRTFVAAYRRAAVPGIAYYGRRVMLGPRLTERLLGGAASPPSLLTLVRSDSQRIEEAIRIPFLRRKGKPGGTWGCNWGIFKAHLLAINGFDEDYQAAGVGEDFDVEWRLRATGVGLESMKHRAVVYHLHHPQSYSALEVQKNFAVCKRKQALHRVWCPNGILQPEVEAPALLRDAQAMK
jgi:cellulose synthase/poly-beta-1,6-N-acetylglucosamine synthase-like glycosyltransferase